MGAIPKSLLNMMLTDWLRPTRPSVADCAARARAWPECPAEVSDEQLRAALRRMISLLRPRTVYLARGERVAALSCAPTRTGLDGEAGTSDGGRTE